jgi:hypothetical protein
MGPTPLFMDEKAEARRNLEIEFLHKLVALRNEDLKFADTKGGVMLTLAVAIAAAALTAFGKFADNHAITTTVAGVAAAVGFAFACVFATLAVISAVRAVQPRIDATDEIAERIIFGGKFNGVPALEEDRRQIRDVMSAPITAAMDTPFAYLHALGFVQDAESVEAKLAAHCLRTARSAYVKYRFIHAATRWIGLEASTFVIAGAFFVIFVGQAQ